jgi:glycosyltransferase involved in cell wall biosynthesis
MGKVFLSVVIPSFNEIENLQKGVLEKAEKFLASQKYEYEVIVVDDGSTDGSVEFVEKFAKENLSFKLIKNSHLGKAGAVTAGILAAVGEYVLFSDMDQATPIEELDKLLPYLKDKYDIVIGSRNTNRKGSPMSRQIISRSAIILRKLIVGMPEISDTQCGFKAFKKESAQKLFSRVSEFHNGFKKISGSSVSSGFDVELLYLAKNLGYKIKEVQVEWIYVETRRVNPIKDSVEGLVDLFRIKSNAVLGKYK